MPRRLRDRARRRRGQAARAADRRPRQARRAVRRQLPADRLRALEPRQRRLPPDRRADAVQEPLARPPHLARPGGCRRCSATTSRRCRRRCAAARAGSSGSADAIYQNLNLLNDERPDYVIVFGADHIYRMDPRQMVEQHIESGAGVTVAALRAPIDQADQFGVIETGAPTGARSRAFREKPTDAVGLPDAPDQVFASMGNYVFTAEALIDAVTADAERRGLRARHRRQHHPGARRARRGAGLRLRAQRGPGRDRRATAATGATSGRSTPTTTRTWTSISVDPIFNLYNREWPILTWPEPLPPAKFVFDEDGRRGHALDSMVCAGVVVSGGDGAALGALAGRAPALVRRGRGLDPHARRRGRPQRGRAARDRRQERADRRRARRSASTPRPTASASTSPHGGIVVIPKGAVVEA